MIKLHELAQDIARHNVTQHSTLRFVIDFRNKHPFAVKHRMLYWARKAHKQLQVGSPAYSVHKQVLRVHNI